MVMARADNFSIRVIIAFLAVIVLAAGYYYLWLFLKEFYKPILAVVAVYTLIDLFILEPGRAEDCKKHGPERLERLRKWGR